MELILYIFKRWCVDRNNYELATTCSSKGDERGVRFGKKAGVGRVDLVTAN